MVRVIHDVSNTYTPPADAVWETAIPTPAGELVCHNDLAPWNLIIGDRWVFIDWDASAPSTRIWDLAYAAQAFTLSDTTRDPLEAAGDLAALIDGYRADHRIRHLLPDTMIQRTAAMYDLLRTSHEASEEPWASMYMAGHGEHWSAAHSYVRSHRDVWLAALATA
ncbi:phosphotransferase [Microbacterium sp.]|uniref:phosphotransferase n=1 Tax=Microbacterium sp. TaxID=51671 RepID=UPI0035239BAA